MDIPQLSSFCGFSLKRGTLTIGWVTLVCSVVIATVGGCVLAVIGYLELQPNRYLPRLEDKDRPRPDLPQLKLLSLLIVVVHLLRSALASLLLLGVYHDKPVLVWCWSLFSLVTVLVSTTFNVLLMVTYREPDYATAVVLLVHLYCAMVSYSYYRIVR